MGTSNGTGGRTSAATVNDEQIVVGGVELLDMTMERSVSKQGRSGTPIPNMVDGLKATLLAGTGVFPFTSKDIPQDGQNKKKLVKWATDNGFDIFFGQPFKSFKMDANGKKVLVDGKPVVTGVRRGAWLEIPENASDEVKARVEGWKTEAIEAAKAAVAAE